MKRLYIPLLLCVGLLLTAALVYWRPKVEPPREPAFRLPLPAAEPVSVRPFPVSEKDSRTVRVAAIQMASAMGRLTANRERMTTLAHQAAAQGAKFIVFPECAVQGYMDVNRNQTWTRDVSEDEKALDVSAIATTVPGSVTRHFAAIAKERGIYIALPLIEVAECHYYNSLVLLDPDGKIAAHHRKNSLWPPGDATWAKEGSGQARVVDTPYGRVGLMICHDLHTMPKALKKERADLVLYSVGWYGPNVENWYRELFPRRYVVPNRFVVVAANWALPPGESDWGGAGYSCIIDKNGGVFAMAKTPKDEEIVIADIPLEAVRTAAVPAATDIQDE
jgi:predicted amidohydrolase